MQSQDTEESREEGGGGGGGKTHVTAAVKEDSWISISTAIYQSPRGLWSIGAGRLSFGATAVDRRREGIASAGTTFFPKWSIN